MKVNDLFVLDSVYNNQNEISDIIANLNFPQKYINLEWNGELYSLELVSVDDYEFVVRVEDNIVDEE